MPTAEEAVRELDFSLQQPDLPGHWRYPRSGLVAAGRRDPNADPGLGVNFAFPARLPAFREPATRAKNGFQARLPGWPKADDIASTSSRRRARSCRVPEDDPRPRLLEIALGVDLPPR